MNVATRFRSFLWIGLPMIAVVGLITAVSDVNATVADYQALIQADASLIHHYDLDGVGAAAQLADKKGTADMAVVAASPTLGAAGFDGTSDSVDFTGGVVESLATGAAAVTLDPVSFTSEAIVRMDLDGTQYVFTAHEGGGGDRTLMVTQDFFGDVTAAVGAGVFGPGADYLAQGAMVPGDWYFLAACFDINGTTTNMQTYAANLSTGGALVAGTPVTEPAGVYNTSATSLWLGGAWFGHAPFEMDGAIDEAAIFNGCLDASTLAGHLAAIQEIPEPSSVLLLTIGMLSLTGLRRRK